MVEHLCENCTWYRTVKTEEGQIIGVCKRHSPTHEGFPGVRSDDWCGDFRSFNLGGF